jgi:hypothetical protein
MKIICSECGTMVKGRTEYDVELAFDLHAMSGECEKITKKKEEGKYNEKILK